RYLVETGSSFAYRIKVSECKPRRKWRVLINAEREPLKCRAASRSKFDIVVAVRSWAEGFDHVGAGTVTDGNRRPVRTVVPKQDVLERVWHAEDQRHRAMRGCEVKFRRVDGCDIDHRRVRTFSSKLKPTQIRVGECLVVADEAMGDIPPLAPVGLG